MEEWCRALMGEESRGNNSGSVGVLLGGVGNRRKEKSNLAAAKVNLEPAVANLGGAVKIVVGNGREYGKMVPLFE